MTGKTFPLLLVLVSNIRNYCVLLLCVSLCATGVAASGIHPLSSNSSQKFLSFASSNSVFQVGEELTYNVSYAFYDIGQVKIKIVDKVVEGKMTYYKAAAYIDSYKGVPLVDLHSVYESNIDSSLYSHQFKSRTKRDEGWYGFTYHFKYDENKVVMDQGWWNSNKVEKSETLTIDTLSQDGLSLFFLARENVLSARTMNIPTIVSEVKGNTSIRFMNEHKDEKIDAVDYPIDCVHFEGNAGFVGIFGLTGDFEGWFSNDEARVPILAKMKVIIGSIRIELMRWKRAGWVPPKYNESGR